MALFGVLPPRNPVTDLHKILPFKVRIQGHKFGTNRKPVRLSISD